ncbi:putative two-component sensor kinase [Salmonella enterica subsp. enterica]|uniref:Putative two-component sensor kinase n=1 Tax=Salmonella enterica I TaxID=59201 RepID=A0A379X0H9_SALET|nr:putative two-component sensor kinase [Salmonella enterica subsp. enterica]
MSYLRSLARHAVFSWRQKISPLLYGLPRWLSSPTRSFWRRALGNVLDNAIDFTPENGVITLSAQPMGRKAILQVTDSGCGIPDFALPRIFDRFYSLPVKTGVKQRAWTGVCQRGGAAPQR